MEQPEAEEMVVTTEEQVVPETEQRSAPDMDSAAHEEPEAGDAAGADAGGSGANVETAATETAAAGQDGAGAGSGGAGADKTTEAEGQVTKDSASPSAPVLGASRLQVALQGRGARASGSVSAASSGGSGWASVGQMTRDWSGLEQAFDEVSSRINPGPGMMVTAGSAAAGVEVTRGLFADLRQSILGTSQGQLARLKALEENVAVSFPTRIFCFLCFSLALDFFFGGLPTGCSPRGFSRLR